MGLRARRGSQVWGKATAALALGLAAQMLTGCGGFFVYPGNTTTGSSGSSSTDYVFAAGSTSGTNYISAYSISNGSLTAASGSPMSVSYTPQSMVVSTNNEYLFVASGSSIYSYSIGTGGVLSSVGNVGNTSHAITVSPDGQWLLGIEAVASAGTTTTLLDVYSISGGSLASLKQTPITSANTSSITFLSEDTIQVAPNGAFVAVTLGTGGAAVFPFNTSSGNGTIGTEYTIGTASAQSGFNALAIDANSYLYLVGASNGTPVIYSYSVNSSGVPNTTAITPAPTTSVGNGPLWVTVSSNSAYVYVANSTAGTISEFSTSSTTGALTYIGAVTNAPTSVSALGRDSTGNYLIALGANTSSGLEPFTINSGGTLSAGTSVGAGTNSPAALAMTH
jgi:6-phosphogluconolactonase (cycloisomerase 2 family)